jgi:hypothetical protein
MTATTAAELDAFVASLAEPDRPLFSSPVLERLASLPPVRRQAALRHLATGVAAAGGSQAVIDTIIDVICAA